MKRYGNLFSKICTMDNMRLAYERATKGKKHYREVLQIKNVEEYLQDLLYQIKTHTYKTSEYHVFSLYTGGKWREIYKLPMKDRIVLHAIMNVIEPIFRHSFIRDTYSSIKGRGTHDGLARVKKAMKDVPGTAYCLKLDIKKFYPSINKEILKQKIRTKFKDVDLLMLLDEIIDSCEHGVPIGNYTSQYFANFYLTRMDHWIKEELGIKYYFRYCDDIVILGSSKERLKLTYLKILQRITDLDLSLKPNWQIFPVESRSVDFLGFKIKHSYTLVRSKTKNNFIKKLIRCKSLNLLLVICGCYWGIFCHANCTNLWFKYLGVKNHKQIRSLFKSAIQNNIL